MKQLLPFFLLLLLTAACTKYETEYTVNCRIGASFFGSKVSLVVTGNGGDVLHIFDVPNLATNFTGNFPFTGNDPVEEYDLHLVVSDTFNNCFTQVFSHFDVPNGAPVFFVANTNFFPFADRITFLLINGIETFDSVEVAGEVFFNSHIYYPAEKKLEVFLVTQSNQGSVINLRANGEQEFRHLYLPDSLLQDSVSVDWQDFNAGGTNRTVELPGGGSVSELEVTAVSPDYKKFTHLRRFFSWMSSGSQFIPPDFIHPSGLDEPVAYRIRTVQGTSEFEKIFQPGEPLHFEAADMAIGNISASVQKLSIETSGDIDMLRVDISAFSQNDPGCVLFWQMEGKPGSFKNRNLNIPGLRPLFPNQLNIPQALTHGVVRAMQFDKYGYEQVREGFPFRLAEPFAIARSGYKAIWKFY